MLTLVTSIHFRVWEELHDVNVLQKKFNDKGRDNHTTDDQTMNVDHEDQIFYLKLRLQLVTNKLALLVRSVQEETISLNDYLAMIKVRIYRDTILCQFLHVQGEFENEQKVQNRLNIMQLELNGALAAQQEEEEEG